MLKMMIPEDAVRHQMTRDQADAKVIRAVFGDKITEDTSPKLDEKEKAIAARFRKMLALRIPKDAVRHKMVNENIDKKIIDAVVGLEGISECSQLQSAKMTGQKIKGKKSDLTEEEELVASQYRKLIKMQIPRNSVLQRMQKEGVSEKIIHSVFGESSILSKPSTDSIDTQYKCGNQLVSLHWTPLTGEELDQSVWSANTKQNTTEPEGGDMDSLVELFQKKKSTAVNKEKKNDDSTIGSEKAQLLDLTRANNVAISLS